MKKHNLLILGAGRGQLGLIKAAKNLGIRTTVASLPSSTAPGLEFADKIVWADIADPDAILDAAKEEGITAIATSCADTGLPALGKVVDEFDLVGLSELAAQICNDKILMKDAFLRNGVKTAAYETISTTEQLDNAIQNLGFPLVIKATDLQGSQGISIVKNRTEALEGFHHAMELTKREDVIIEQFIEGDEFGAQALVINGKVVFVLPHGDEVFVARTAVPVGHYAPLDREREMLDEITVQVEKAIHAVGIDNAAVNVDLISDGNDIYLIELTGRVGANGLPEMVSRYFGLNYYEIVARLAIGEDLSKYWLDGNLDSTPSAVRMIIGPELYGKVSSIKVDQEAFPNADFLLFKQVGDEIAGFTNSGDCLGQIAVSAETLETALHNLDLAEKAVLIELDRVI